MAKAKSKKITIEEALVPVEEQEYNIPNNWIWIYQNFVCQLANGEKMSGEEYPYLEVKYLRGDTDAEIKDSGRFITANTKVILVDGENSGEVFEVLEDGYMGSTFKALNISEIVNEKYLLYYVDSKRELLKKNKTGSAIPHLNKRLFLGLGFPLPPLPEQQRIVEQIESLFSKLDEAKEKAQEVIDRYEARNAAVYNDAFSGRLTAQWRKDNYKENKWETKRFDEVADIKSNLVEPSNYLEFPHIAPDNIEKRTGILRDYHTIAEDGVKSGKHRFYAGQILYSKIRPYLSKVVMVDFDGLCSADMYPIEAKENTKYLLYYMLSDMFLEQASSAGSRSVLPKINQKELSAIKVRITSDEEQKEVVRILDYLLPMMQQVRDKAVQVVDNIDTIKKSILAKAFRGELGTNISEDESAMELLKIILNKGEC
jgi:type-1 restriction enzyme ecoDI specificity protein